jgi:hypothetical protein
MKFYKFRQNNSGGSFDVNDTLASHVYLEADDAEHANFLAERKGIYFNGVDSDIDCSCCGDRWYSADESEYDILECETAVEAIAKAKEDVSGGFSGMGYAARIHLKDGTVIKVENEKQ